MNSILVPTDFSNCAKHAFNLAVELCERTGAELLLLHVADLPVASDPMGTNLHTFFSPELIQQMENNLTDKLTEFIGEEDRVKITKKLIWGNPFTGISGYLSSDEVDLVVIGTKGASGAKELFIGSNAEKVVRHTKVPVISVKNETHLTDLKEIVFGNELGQESHDLIRQIQTLQRILGARIHLVRINTPSNFKRDKEVWMELDAFAKQHAFDNHTINIYNDFHEDNGLIYFADHVKADLIAMGTHGRRGVNHLISGSIAEDIVNHAKRPIWTYVVK